MKTFRAMIANWKRNRRTVTTVLAVLSVVVTAYVLMAPAITITDDVATPEAGFFDGDDKAEPAATADDAASATDVAPAADEPEPAAEPEPEPAVEPEPEPADSEADPAEGEGAEPVEDVAAEGDEEESSQEESAAPRDSDGDSAETSNDSADDPELLHQKLDLGDGAFMEIRVEDPRHVLPEGTRLEAGGIDPEKLDATLELMRAKAEEKEDISSDYSGVVAADLKLVDADGNDVKPSDKVLVSIACPVIERDAQFSLVRVKYAEHPENPDGPDGKDRASIVKLKEVDPDGHTVKFEAKDFSPYGIVYIPPAEDEELDDGADDAAGEDVDAEGEAGDEDGLITTEDEPEPEAVELTPVNAHAQSFSETVEAADGTLVNVVVDADECTFPDGTTMHVEAVEEQEVLDAALGEAADATGMAPGHMGVLAADITFLDAEGNEVEPAKPVHVAMVAQDVPDLNQMAIVHVDDEQIATLVEDAEPHANLGAVYFDADAFSVYAMVYTVDFYWEVDGKTYEFSIPGGGYVSLEALIETLGVAEGEDRDVTADEAADEGQVEDGQPADTLTMGDVQISDQTKKFVADVERVELSSSDLLWVGKNDADTTVGELKEANGLECQYSAELTEDQIAEINAQTVEAGDWALISMQPFISEESLTVTMKSGDQFVIKVTDAQISTHVITANGEDFIITVTYGDDAQIPEGATLEADEIDPGSDAYKEYLADAQEAIDAEAQPENDSDIAQDADEAAEDESGDDEGAVEMAEVTSIDFARFFDIRIMANGEKVEPAAPVKVTVTYADALEVGDDSELLAVHFGTKGTEVIEASSDEAKKSVVFMQDSFSVTGTVVSVDQNAWPNNNGSYVLYTQIADQYYAINHDGELVPVTRNGNQLSFEDADVLFHGMDEYLWQYEHTRRYVFMQGWVDEDRLFFNAGANSVWLNPADEAGIGNDRTLSRTNERIRVASGSDYYITADEDNSHIVGQGNADNAIPIYFANGFNNVNKAIVHFVDRNGIPIPGVEYGKDNPNVVPSPDDDGTFAIRYNWNGATGVVDLSEDFSKTGYTYASTHLSGVQGGTTLKHDGLTIDAKLTERSNGNLYIGTDIGSNNDYYPYSGNATSSTTADNQSGQRSLGGTIRAAYTNGAREDYATTTDKDIYVILDPAPNTISWGDDPTDVDADDPRFTKTLEDNEDGTYTLSLAIEGHANSINESTNANVLFVVDTSSSMHHEVGNSTRIEVTHDALKKLGDDLMAYNDAVPGRVQVSMVTFDGSVSTPLDWTDSKSQFDSVVDSKISLFNLHRGTDWEDGLKAALTQADKADDDPTFVVFFTDGEPSQYTNYHGAATWENNNVSNSYWFYFNSFLSRETSNDEARALVDAGYQLYGVFAFNNSGHTYPNGATGDESDSDLLHNLLKYGYNTNQNLGAGSSHQRFFPTDNQAALEAAFDKILESINIRVGFDQIKVTDDITSLTSTGINLTNHAVGGFTYTRSGGEYGDGTVWTDAPAATHTDEDGKVTSVEWDLGNTVLEKGVTYTVSFKVWPSQEAYDWLANLQNETKTWDDVVAAGLDAPNGSNPQIVKNGDSYSLLTNKPSLDKDGNIINNSITYKKTRSETVTQADVPAGTQWGEAIIGEDDDGNKTTTTYTNDQGVITKTVVTEKKTYFPNPDPMPLVPESMNVMKKWETSMNTSHPADALKFRVLVDGKYYQNDGSLVEGEAGQANAKVLPVSDDNSWMNSINIATGIVKYFDDDGNALSEALVLETGHKYTLEEFDLMEGGNAFLYYTSYEFHSQTMRPMIVDGTLKYLVLVDDDNPKPDGAETHTIGDEEYYVAATGSGEGVLSGTNYRTGELDITKIIENSSGVELTDEQLSAQTFTYRVTLRIPDGTDPAGIVGYEYVPRTQDNAYTLFGYQEGETAFPSDIDRFSGKTFRSWNTLVYRELVEWENVGGRIISKTDGNGNIIWKVPADEDGYHAITYDMTLNKNEVIRFTNLPTGTQYTIQEIYANHYQADNLSDSAGHVPIVKASNIAEEGYEIKQVLTTNGTVSQTAIAKDTVSGTIDTPNVRYYNQFTNELKSVKTQITILKKNQDGSSPLPGAVFDLYDEAGYQANPQVPLKTGLVSSSEEGEVGTIDLGELTDGVYYLVETAAPAGYNKLTDPVTITVSHGSVTYNQENSTMDSDGRGTQGTYETGYQLTVVNDEGATLPHTGGPGTKALYLFGVTLICLAGAGFVMKRRRTHRA